MKKKKSGWKNGKLIEGMYNCINQHNLIDDMINNIEIKSCEEWVYYQYHKDRPIIRIKGRFVFNNLQQEILLKTNGRYRLVVHNEGNILFNKLVYAKDYDYLINGRKTIKWTYFFIQELIKEK